MSKARASWSDGLRRFLPPSLAVRLPGRSPSPAGPPIETDPVGAQVRAAVSAYADAKKSSADSYRVRVDTMIDDLFTRYEEFHDRRHP